MAQRTHPPDWNDAFPPTRRGSNRPVVSCQFPRCERILPLARESTPSQSTRLLSLHGKSAARLTSVNVDGLG